MFLKQLKYPFYGFLCNWKMKTGNYERALYYCKKLISQSPEDSDVHTIIGYCYNKLSQHTAAVKSLERALAIDPDAAEAHEHLGYTLMGLEKYQESIEAFQRAFRINPRLRKRNLDGLICALVNNGMFDESLDACKEYVRFNPKSSEAHYKIGWVLSEMGKLGEAENPLRIAIKLNPKHFDARYCLIIVLNELGKKTEARKHFEELARLNPNYPKEHKVDLSDR